MSDIALPMIGDTVSPPIIRVRDLETEQAADALYNALRIWNDRHPLARWTLIGYLLVFRAWINREFWVRWNSARALQGKPSHWQWIGMILFGCWTAPITRAVGRMAERSIARHLAALPKDHAHAVVIDDPRLRHLPLLGIPMILRIGGRDGVIEFVEQEREIHIRWDDASACLWIAFSDDANLLPISNVRELATQVVMGKNRIEVSAGPRTCTIPFPNLALILEELSLGGGSILCRNMASTSISTNAAETTCFERIA